MAMIVMISVLRGASTAKQSQQGLSASGPEPTSQEPGGPGYPAPEAAASPWPMNQILLSFHRHGQVMQAVRI